VVQGLGTGETMTTAYRRNQNGTLTPIEVEPFGDHYIAGVSELYDTGHTTQIAGWFPTQQDTVVIAKVYKTDGGVEVLIPVRGGDLETRVAEMREVIRAGSELRQRFVERAESAEARVKELEATIKRVCDWTQDDGVWHTGCGHDWEYANDGPVENGTRYCQYCGGEMNHKAGEGE